MSGNVIHSLPLARLPLSTRKILSRLLNSTKVIPSDGPLQLPRDWTGLARLINISPEKNSIKQHEDPTAFLLDIWPKSNPSVTVGDLLRHLEVIDRYDVYDDVYDDVRDDLRKARSSGDISGYGHLQVATPNKRYNGVSTESDIDQVSYEVKPGSSLMYDAVILNAEEDKSFAAEMSKILTKHDFQICTVDDLLAEHVPVAQLISERCRCIILVFSPEFLNSMAMSFYDDYSQTTMIESNVREKKILPVIYRLCELPGPLRIYTKLFYPDGRKPVEYFWERLRANLARPIEAPKQKRSIGSPTTPPHINIDELQVSNSRGSSRDSEELPLLQTGLEHSASMSALDCLSSGTMYSSDDAQSLSNFSRLSASSSTRKKKISFSSVFSKVALPFSKKKSKKDLLED